MVAHGGRTMIEVREMDNYEIDNLLSGRDYGHLACCKDDRPYVVPVHYVYDGSDIFIYTTEGKKSEIIQSNPLVCLQVEDVVNGEDWRSIIIEGTAIEISKPKEREKAIRLIRASNPSLTPAVSVRWMDCWVRENREVIYRITPKIKTGRKSVASELKAVFAKPRANEQMRIY
jgi:nitroimidazol reductase NimA-like FMN-containing flavoprotein (pyridoxamine 5'-phosphate oxidase superfamily)